MAKAARTRPRDPPVAAMRTAVGAAAAAEEEGATPEDWAEAPAEEDLADAEPLAVPVPVLAVAAVPVPVAAAVAVAPPAVVRMYWLMQLVRHWEYLSVAAALPSPWSHLATQLVAWFMALSSGLGTPTQRAWQLTSPGAHLDRHVSSAVGVWEGVAAVVVVVWASTVAARGRRAPKNFILRD